MKNTSSLLRLATLAFATTALGGVARASDDHPPVMDQRAAPVEHDAKAFPHSPDPVFNEPYDFQRQLDIYGAKHMNPTVRPLLELGREMYGPGELSPGKNLFGEKNLAHLQLLLFGDMRMVAASNNNGTAEKGIGAIKLNLAFDLKLTSTERLHYFFTPLDKDGRTTRFEFGRPRDRGASETIFDMKPEALFFEGDLARIGAGFSGKDTMVDIPFAVGLIPILFQNGVWAQDAVVGGAFTIPARNSPALQISNMDVTFFAGLQQVTTGAIPNDHQSSVFGFNAFIEANSGYWEIGYGYVDGRGPSSDLSYHNFSAAFTRRYFDYLSNSIRVIWNFGQKPGVGRTKTADGFLILLENSFATSKPLTLVPYLNLFAGFDKPQSLFRAAGAGGVLLNTGINFETDGITGFPSLEDSAHDTFGGAFGVEYLFDLSQQLVVEFATLDTMGNDPLRPAKGRQSALGVRFQRKLNHAWIFRADGILAEREGLNDQSGFRIELRRKF